MYGRTSPSVLDGLASCEILSNQLDRQKSQINRGRIMLFLFSPEVSFQLPLFEFPNRGEIE
jgi:hypothetical protein